METPDMGFLPSSAYYKALLKGVESAQKRIIIQAMDVRWGPRLEELVPLLEQAAQRGVEVRIIGDAYSKFQATMPHIARGASPSWRHINAINERLRSYHAHITYTGKVGLNPFAGRTHSKITILDDRVYTFGGINFTDDSFQNTDYMLEIDDPLLANRLYRLVRNIEQGSRRPLPDLEEQLGGEATLLFDGGTPKSSIIYDTACKIVSTAVRVYYVSQMCPSGPLAKKITATNNACYFIKARQADPPANFALLVDKARYKITNRYQGSKYIHAKFILTEDRNGSKHVLSGTNNFSWRGVAYGTREIAVHSTDPALWQSFYAFLQHEIIGPLADL
jgi:cardiolipin synthase A/B